MNNNSLAARARQRSSRGLPLRGAFSLVEVVLALSIATFAVVVIVSLLPVGIQSSRDSLEETVAVNILSEVVADRKATPFGQQSVSYKIPALTNGMTATTNIFGATDNTNNSTDLIQARYRVQCIITPPPSGRLDPYLAYLKVSWPARSTNANSFVESVVAFPQP